MQIVVVALIAFGQTVAREHFHEGGAGTFYEGIPVVATEAGLIAHVVRGDEAVVIGEFFAQIGHGGALHQGHVEFAEESHVVAVSHRVTFIRDESLELTGTVGGLYGSAVFFISAAAQTLEGLGVVADDPAQTLVAGAGDVGPESVRSHRGEVELLPGGCQGIAQVAVTVCYVAVVVNVADKHLEVVEVRHFILETCGEGVAAGVAHSKSGGSAGGGCEAQERPARTFQKVSSIHMV